MTETGPAALTTEELFKGKHVAVFGLPGAFTPTCSAKHLPGFVANAARFRDSGIDAIACVSVNDAFVMDAWGKDRNVGTSVMMLADGSAEFTRALGLELDLTERGLGVRSQRYSMLVNDGVVSALHIEDGTGLKVSDAETLIGDV
jgi:peroxiredoxin (alkyl hydroperoxide reductase subunit C)